MSDYLELLPAVDITEGRAVQLAQGVAGSERVYGDPVAAARRWQDAGAEWLHLVDLDAAELYRCRHQASSRFRTGGSWSLLSSFGALFFGTKGDGMPAPT